MTEQEIDQLIRDDDKLMNKVCHEHMAENPGHKCWVYGNFVECETCHFHAHLTGHGDMMQHDSGYNFAKYIQ